MWEEFGPLALVFWLCWIAFGVLAIEGVVLTDWTPFIQGAIGFGVTTAVYWLARDVTGHI